VCACGCSCAFVVQHRDVALPPYFSPIRTVTTHEVVLDAFQRFTTRKDVGVVLISQFVRPYIHCNCGMCTADRVVVAVLSYDHASRILNYLCRPLR